MLSGRTNNFSESGRGQVTWPLQFLAYDRSYLQNYLS